MRFTILGNQLHGPLVWGLTTRCRPACWNSMVGLGHRRGRSESVQEISHGPPLRCDSASRIPPHSAPRPNAEVYRISIKQDEVRYTAMSGGQRATTMRKVPADYRLP